MYCFAPLLDNLHHGDALGPLFPERGSGGFLVRVRGPFGWMKVALTSSWDLVKFTCLRDVIVTLMLRKQLLQQALHQRATIEEGGCDAESSCTLI